MALETLAEAVVAVKRTTGYGSYGTTTDQVTADIIKFFNDRVMKISRARAWDWLTDPLTAITLISGVTDYTLDADVAAIICIGASGRPALKKISLTEYNKWYYSEELANLPPYYLYIGRNSTTGARKIRVGGLADDVSVLNGFAKIRVPKFTVADIAAGTNFLPLPDDMVGILKRFVVADIKNTQGKKDEWPVEENNAKFELELAGGEEQSDPGEQPASAPPDSYRRKKACRRVGRTA